MKKQPPKRTRIKELTPEVLNSLDQDTLVALVVKLYEQNKQLSEYLQSIIQEKYERKTERHEDPQQLNLFERPKPEPSSGEPPDHEQSGSGRKRPPAKKPP